MESPRESGAVSRKVIIWLSIPLVFVALVGGCNVIVKLKYERERKSWKYQALSQLATTSMTNEQVLTEIDQMKHNLDFGWVHEHVLLMTNGEFLVYAFRHGFNNGFVDHLLLAHGSNGRWYYSTYHFHITEGSENPPGSIAEFASRYAAREFDGKPDSDTCLQHTWPEKR